MTESPIKSLIIQILVSVAAGLIIMIIQAMLQIKAVVPSEATTKLNPLWIDIRESLKT